MKTKIIIIALIFFFSLFVYAQEEKKLKTLNLEKIADDLKFKNGVEFIKLKKPDKAIEELTGLIK